MKTSSDIKKIIKDSLFTGLISLALFGPIVGLKTSSKGQGLFVTPHVSIVVLLVLACIVGRFLIGLNSLRKKEISFISNITSTISNYMDNKGKHVAITGVFDINDSTTTLPKFSVVEGSMNISERDNKRHLTSPKTGPINRI